MDDEEDINKVNEYFSYEHFYVLYCKFWELDTDHDFYISKEDLMRYGNHSLTCSIVDRVFQGAGWPLQRNSSNGDKMGYEDFCYFLLSEEDKTNNVSLGYWFRCIDIRDDGYITYDEMYCFYKEQIQRMENLGHEVVPYNDVIAQMVDLLQIRDGKITMANFINPVRVGQTGVFFDIMFNLTKFLAYEQVTYH